MNDLNLVTYFKASFDIRAVQPDDGTDIIWEIVCAIRTWALDKYNTDNKAIVPEDLPRWSWFKNGDVICDNDEKKLLYCRPLTFRSQKTGVTYWACIITETPKPPRDHAQRQWLTNIVYRGYENEGRLDLVIKYRDRAGYIGHYESAPAITVPRVIRLILGNKKLYCHSAGIPLSATPTELKTGDGKMFKNLIFNPARDLPLIYISPRRKSDQSDDVGELLLSPDEVTKCVMGNAFVYYSQSLDFSEEAGYLLGSRYRCDNGNVRIYFPKIENGGSGDDPRRHRLIYSNMIEEWGSDELFGILRRAFAQNSDFYKRILDYETCSLMRTREYQQSVMDEKDNALKKMDDKIAEMKNLSEDERKQLFDLAQDEADKSDRLSQELGDVYAELEQVENARDELKQRNYALGQQIDELRKKHAGGLVDENSQRLLGRLEKMPSTCQDVVSILEAAFPDRIVFTPEAHKSLKDCNTSPALLWKLIYGMATEFYDLLINDPANAAKTFANSSGFAYSPDAGYMTRKDNRLMRQYRVIYNGVEVNIEPHFKKGNNDKDENSVRLYFAWEPTVCDKIIIGHCGKHLDNYTTQKLH